MSTRGITDEKYRELFAEQDRLGLSYDELAGRAGVKASTLKWKKSALKRPRRTRTSSGAEPTPEFLPVRVRAEAAGRGVVVEAVPERPYEVQLGSGRVLRVPRGFQPHEVHALVCVLEAVPC